MDLCSQGSQRLDRDGNHYLNAAFKVYDATCGWDFFDVGGKIREYCIDPCMTRAPKDRCLENTYDRACGKTVYCIFKRGHKGQHSEGCLEWYIIPDKKHMGEVPLGSRFDNGIPEIQFSSLESNDDSRCKWPACDHMGP